MNSMPAVNEKITIKSISSGPIYTGTVTEIGIRIFPNEESQCFWYLVNSVDGKPVNNSPGNYPNPICGHVANLMTGTF